MCSCKTKIEFEIDGGGLYSINEIENNDCPTFNECLHYTEIDTKLEDGVYHADLFCSVFEVRYAEGTEYDGENIVENIIKFA